MKYVDTYYVLKLYLDRLVFPRLSFNIDNEIKDIQKIIIKYQYGWIVYIVMNNMNLIMNLKLIVNGCEI